MAAPVLQSLRFLVYQSLYLASSTTVHLDDVTRAHVLALVPKISGNKTNCSARGSSKETRNDALKIANEKFAQAVANGTLPNNGTRWGDGNVQVES